MRRLSAEAAGARDLRALIEQAARGLLGLTGARQVGVVLRTEGDSHAFLLGPDPGAGGRWLPLDRAGPQAGTAAQTADDLLALLMRHGLDPLISIPLVADGLVLGLLAIALPESAALDEASSDLVLLVSDHLVIAAGQAQQRDLAARAERRARELALLAQVRTSVSKQLNLGDIFRDTVEQTARAFGYPLVSLYLLRGETLYLQHQTGYDALPDTCGWDDGVVGRVARSGLPLLLGAPGDGPGVATDSTSGVYVPLHAGGVVCGVLGAESAGAPALGESDLRLLVALAEQLDLAIEFSQLYEALEVRVGQLALVEEISRAVMASLDRDAALRAIVTQVPRAVPCQRLSLASYDPATEHFTVRALWDAGEPGSVAVGSRLPIDETEGCVALRAGRLHYVYDLAESDYPFSRQLLAEGLRSTVHVPIMAPEGCLGILNLCRSAPRAFNERDLTLLSSLAPHLATAFKNAELYARAQDAYAELAAAQERNVQAEKLRALGELASGVAHDFNNLLAIILGHAELIETGDSGGMPRSLRAITQAARDGARTVRRIQEFVRAQPEHHSTPVDLAELAEDVLQLTRPRWRDRMQENGATIIVRRELRSTPPVLGDPAELREVVTNLIMNALDAMPEGGMLTLVTGADRDCVWVEVRDTGVGIAPEARERIFEPFYTTKVKHGTGLGLAVSRSIALRHGGDLTVQSELWVGSRFRLSLPMPDMSRAADTPGESPDEAEVRPLRIMLVEDDNAVRETLARLFAIDGHQVDRMRDGAEALRTFQPDTYDMVCSDLGMPGINGWDLIARLREIDARPVMALLTGWGAQIDPDEARARGIDFVIPKPLDLQTLRAALALAARRTGR